TPPKGGKASGDSGPSQHSHHDEPVTDKKGNDANKNQPYEKEKAGAEGMGQGANVVSPKTVISPEMEAKILEGQRKAPKNELIGGHSPNINNANNNFAVEVLSTNADGTKNVVFTKQFPDGNISKLKKSTLFPDSWTDEQILKSITDVGNTPAISTRLRDGATWHRATINGVEIDVIKVGDDVTSGYPTGTVNASRPSGF
ncbi:EndoU domain-containing protein, partial [Brevibacillus parabrevis]|uniref:EndoU domain-containing protein n=3 Tax=Brevibacillus parabrevis TaxID=54914 RepID=UPI003D1A8EF0